MAMTAKQRAAERARLRAEMAEPKITNSAQYVSKLEPGVPRGAAPAEEEREGKQETRGRRRARRGTASRSGRRTGGGRAIAGGTR